MFIIRLKDGAPSGGRVCGVAAHCTLGILTDGRIHVGTRYILVPSLLFTASYCPDRNTYVTSVIIFVAANKQNSIKNK